MDFSVQSFETFFLENLASLNKEGFTNIVIFTDSYIIKGNLLSLEELEKVARHVDDPSKEFTRLTYASLLSERYKDTFEKNSTSNDTQYLTGIHLKDVKMRCNGQDGHDLNLPYLYLLTKHIVGISFS